MKGIANRQNKLLGRKPLPFGGGRPAPGRSSAKQVAKESFHRRKSCQEKVSHPGARVSGKASAPEPEAETLEPAPSEGEFSEGETPKSEEAEE